MWTLLCEIMLGCSRSWLPGLTWLGVLPCNLAGHVNHDIFIMLLRRRPGHYDTRTWDAMGTRERRGGKRKLVFIYLEMSEMRVMIIPYTFSLSLSAMQNGGVCVCFIPFQGKNSIRTLVRKVCDLRRRSSMGLTKYLSKRYNPSVQCSQFVGGRIA